MPHYLDPKNDLTFKKVFGEHKHLCISLLNSMLPLDESQRIAEIEYQTGELTPEIDILRNSIVDVRCTDVCGRQFIVEMQMYWSESFKKRILFNASKAYIMQLDKGKKYEFLQPVYALSFVNDTFEKSPEMKEEYYHHYKIVNVRHSEKQIKGLEFVFIELPKFVPHSRSDKELWLRFLTEINEKTRQAPNELLENSDLREALDYAEIGAYTKEQLFTYDLVCDAIMTERSVLSDAKNAGIKEGIDKGIKEGVKKVAINLLQKGMTLEEIQELTGLSSEEIHDLRK
jgi:predicted transposase/invertase (TIGR01784 family)